MELLACTKVDEHQMTVACSHDIAWLEVKMPDVGSVNSVKGNKDLTCHVKHFVF